MAGCPGKTGDVTRCGVLIWVGWEAGSMFENLQNLWQTSISYLTRTGWKSDSDTCLRKSKASSLSGNYIRAGLRRGSKKASPAADHKIHKQQLSSNPDCNRSGTRSRAYTKQKEARFPCASLAEQLTRTILGCTMKVKTETIPNSSSCVGCKLFKSSPVFGLFSKWLDVASADAVAAMALLVCPTEGG